MKMRVRESEDDYGIKEGKRGKSKKNIILKI
jgi:hypothetical protein